MYDGGDRSGDSVRQSGNGSAGASAPLSKKGLVPVVGLDYSLR